MILCLGLPNSGKTLLLRSLSIYPKTVDKLETVATVGINVAHINIADSSQSFTVKEIGGEMKPIWETYFTSSVSAILFTIDCSNPVELGPSVIALLEIFHSLSVKSIKPSIVIILTKSDQPGPLSLRDVLAGLLLDDLANSKLLDSSTGLIECSSVTGKGLNDILKWITNFNRIH